MRQTLSNSIIEQFKTMEEQGMINLEVRNNLKEYKDLLDGIKANILKDDDNKVSFHYYHALHSCYSIINKILERLENSQKIHDNTKIVLDSIALFPSINKMIDMVDVENINKNGADEIVHDMLGLTKLARKHDLVQSIDENMKAMNTEFINNGLGGLINRI